MSDDSTPRRLHPATVLIGLIRGAPSTIVAIPAAVAFASDGRMAWVIAAAVALTVIGAVFRWLAWRRFTYALTDDAVVIESGVFSRNRRTIPFDRVQDVDIERKPLARLLGLAKVNLETGGAGKDEGALDSVSVAEAQRLRGVIRRRAAEAHEDEVAVVADDVPAARPETAGSVLFAMSLSRVLLWGLFNFSLVWLAVIFGALQYLDNLVPFDFADPRNWVAIEQQAEMSGRLTIATAVMIALLFAVLGVLAGLIRTIARDYGFTLTDEGGRFRRVRGLLTRTEAVIALKRVQLALVETGFLRRALGWSGLRLQTLGGSGDKGGRQEVAPFARDGEVDAILAPLALVRPDPADLAQVARGHVWRTILRTVGLPLVAILVAGYFVPPVLFALVLLVIPLGLAMLRRRFHRFGLPADTLYVQRGVLSRQMWIVPAGNVQAVSIRRTWPQRRLGTATLLPDTAGAGALSSPGIVDIRHGDAWALAEMLRARR